jgi:hypothetical protein
VKCPAKSSDRGDGRGVRGRVSSKLRHVRQNGSWYAHCHP